MQINTDSTSMDFGFELPEGGMVKHICQIEDGIDVKKNENSGKTSMRLPLRVVSEGDSLNVSFSQFIPIESKWGEKQICSLLTLTGVAEKFEKKFNDDTGFTDEEFVNAMKIALPGKMLAVQGEIAKRKGTDQDQYNVKRWEKVGKGKKAAPKVEEKATTNDADGDDW